jgi:hypothetical protein
VHSEVPSSLNPIEKKQTHFHAIPILSSYLSSQQLLISCLSVTLNEGKTTNGARGNQADKSQP